MIVAVVAVWMMKVTIDEIIHMIAVRHCFMAAAGTVHMILVVSGTAMIWRATVWILCRDLDYVFIDVIIVHMMKMAIVEIVHMTIVTDRGVATSRAVLMRMVRVSLVSRCCHGLLPIQ